MTMWIGEKAEGVEKGNIIIIAKRVKEIEGECREAPTGQGAGRGEVHAPAIPLGLSSRGQGKSQICVGLS